MIPRAPKANYLYRCIAVSPMQRGLKGDYWANSLWLSCHCLGACSTVPKHKLSLCKHHGCMLHSALMSFAYFVSPSHVCEADGYRCPSQILKCTYHYDNEAWHYDIFSPSSCSRWLVRRPWWWRHPRPLPPRDYAQGRGQRWHLRAGQISWHTDCLLGQVLRIQYVWHTFLSPWHLLPHPVQCV